MSIGIKNVLIVSDFDGTMYDERFGIPQRNLDAIKRYIDKGGLFTLCTGRSRMSVQNFVNKVPMSAPIILNNGGVIYDYKTDCYIQDISMPYNIKEVIREVWNRYPDVGCEALSSSNIYVVKNSEYIMHHLNRERLAYIECPLVDVTEPLNKVFFSIDSQTIQQIKAYLDQKNYDNFDVVQTSPQYLELIPKGVNKGTALQALSKFLNIKQEHTAAVGDYYNDIQLIEYAGIGAAVNTAPDMVKEKANLILGGCQDGIVADLIEYVEKCFNL